MRLSLGRSGDSFSSSLLDRDESLRISADARSKAPSTALSIVVCLLDSPLTIIRLANNEAVRGQVTKFPGYDVTEADLTVGYISF